MVHDPKPGELWMWSFTTTNGSCHAVVLVIERDIRGHRHQLDTEDTGPFFMCSEVYDESLQRSQDPRIESWDFSPRYDWSKVAGAGDGTS